MVFPAPLDDEFADILDYHGKLVGADMRMRINQDILASAEFNQQVEHFPDVTPFGRAGIELAVGEGAGATLAVAVVGIRIHDPLAGKACHIRLALVDILSTLQHYRPESQRDKFQRSEHSRRPRTHDNYLLGTVHIGVFRESERLIIVLRRIGLIAVAPHRFPARIDGALLEHPLQTAGLGLDFLDARLAGERADDFEFFHCPRTLMLLIPVRCRAECARRQGSGSTRPRLSSPRCR